MKQLENLTKTTKIIRILSIYLEKLENIKLEYFKDYNNNNNNNNNINNSNSNSNSTKSNLNLNNNNNNLIKKEEINYLNISKDLYEIEIIIEKYNEELNGIEIVNENKEFLIKLGIEVRTKGREILNKGLNSLVKKKKLLKFININNKKNINIFFKNNNNNKKKKKKKKRIK
jgi:hypothetical protein